jgi:hypothetical protein
VVNGKTVRQGVFHSIGPEQTLNAPKLLAGEFVVAVSLRGRRRRLLILASTAAGVSHLYPQGVLDAIKLDSLVLLLSKTDLHLAGGRRYRR